MNNQFNNSLRKEIIEKADIVNIISQYVSLEKRGNNFIGLCPFHDDKNPSMSVSQSKHIFKCFSCGVSGDAISFVAKIKNTSNYEAMKEVGSTVGITVQPSKKDLEKIKNQKYYEITKESANFFHFCLKNTTVGTEALKYLYNRQLNDEVINRFMIGVADNDNSLAKTLISKNYLPLDVAEVNLIRNSNDKYSDVFKNRIIFPIKDLQGNIVGFSGRIYLPNANESKYLNTSETVIFKKGQILYNYSDCINEIKNRNCVYLFEGFMDVIAAFRAGVENAVASMGTALTLQQVQAIGNVTKNVVIGYDSDGPGIIATIKAISMFSKAGFNVRVVTMPDGKDPDEYINKNSQRALNEYLLNKTVSAMEFLYNYEKANSNLIDINGIESFKQNIFKHLKNFSSNTVVETYLRKVSEDVNISFQSLIGDYNNSLNTLINEIPSELATKSENKKVSLKKYHNRFLSSERKLLCAAYNNRKACLEIEAKLENIYVDKTNREILYKLLNYYRVHQIMNDKNLYKDFSMFEIDTLQDILKNETLPSVSEIDQLIKIVKQWPYVIAVDREVNNSEKTIEGLTRLTEYKKTYIKIKKNKKE